MEPEIIAYLREHRPDLLEQFYRLSRPPVEYEHLRQRHDTLYRACEKMLEAWDCRHPAAGIVAIQEALFGAPAPSEESGEPRQAMGYALAMRVLQSDLYAKLDDEERGECDAFIRAGVGEPRQGGEPSGLVWSREKPTEQIRAIVCYTPRHGVMLRTVAEFIPHKTVRSEDFLSEDCDPGDCDWYDKEEDCYWVNEGWWESSFVADTNWQLDGEVTHWMPLPPAPRTQASPPAEAPEADGRGA